MPTEYSRPTRERLQLGYDWGTEQERDWMTRLRAEICISLDLFPRIWREQFSLPA